MCALFPQFWKELTFLAFYASTIKTYVSHHSIPYQIGIINMHSDSVLVHFVNAGINSVGVGSSTLSTPLHLDPGMKPERLDEMDGVSISVIKADSSVSVVESSTSLLLGWHKPTNVHGFAPSHYLVEYWISSMIKEIHKMSLLPASGTMPGTFALTFADTTTDSLSIGITALRLKAALETLPNIQSVEVTKSRYNPNHIWTITFLVECP